MTGITSPVYRIKRHMMFACPDICDDNLDHLVKMASPRFLHYEVAIVMK